MGPAIKQYSRKNQKKSPYSTTARYYVTFSHNEKKKKIIWQRNFFHQTKNHKTLQTHTHNLLKKEYIKMIIHEFHYHCRLESFLYFHRYA